MKQQMCHCGKPLHYSNPKIRELVEKYITDLGECIVVRVGLRKWKVPRHYIALHGLRPANVETLGFEEIQ